MEPGQYTIEWQDDVELVVVTDFDEATETATESNEIFRKGQYVEVDIIEVHENDDENNGEITVDMQFGDGSMAYNVNVTLFRRLRPVNSRKS